LQNAAAVGVSAAGAFADELVNEPCQLGLDELV
jgi:hypothetical protein